MSVQELWAIFFRYLTDKSKRDKINEIVQQEEGIAMVGQVVRTISQDEEERARILREETNALDWQNYVVTAKRKGREEGREEGRKEGRKERDKYILDLITQGLSTEEIKQRLENN